MMMMIIATTTLFSSNVDASSSVGIWNVLDYGAVADNKTDSTTGFANAIAAAASAGGGTVFAPAGIYRFNGHLNIQSGVTLRGSYSVVPSHDLRGGPIAQDGTIFIPTEGRADASAPPFIHVNSNAAASGFVVYYQEQETINLPVPYPWTFHLEGNNAAVTDIELLGAFNGINATASARHYIARVQGQPLNIGVYIDQTYDIGRVEDVHFNPWFSSSHPFVEYQLTHGRAFVFGRSDWEYVLNTFAFGYAVGYHFIETPTGSMNGNFVGLGADLAVNASVLVDQSQPAGLLITNGEFTAFHNDQWLPNSTVESSQVVVSSSNTGAVKFVDCSFWGPNSQIALLDGTGTVTFSSCEFVQWDEQKRDGRAAISTKTSLILNGNHFNQDKNQVRAEPETKRLVIIGNVMEGALRVDVASNSTIAQIGMNAAS